MWELYWLTRVESIGVISSMVVLISILISVFILIHWIMNDEMTDKFKRILNICIITGTISSLLVIFLPTKNDLLLIYGLGPTVDYIQDNEKVQELPDKCVEAFSKWVESLNEDK